MISGTREAVEMAKQMILEKAGLQSGASGKNEHCKRKRGICYLVVKLKRVSSIFQMLYLGSSNGSWGGHYQDHGGHRPDQGAGMAPSGNQGDYSAQWIDYYRKMGMTRDAEAIERSTAVSWLRYRNFLSLSS